MISLLEEYNPWWFNEGWYKADIHLNALNKQKFVVDRGWFFGKVKGVVLIYGSRQVGKTVWIKQRINELLNSNHDPHDILYISGEGISAEDLALLLKHAEVDKRKYVFIDEISSVDKWPYVIKRFYDAGLFKNATVILTGSSSINLKKSGEQLPGRIGKVVHFYPFSFRELLSSIKDLDTCFHVYSQAGGFARAVDDLLQHRTIREETFSVYSAWLDGEVVEQKKSPRTVNYLLSRVLVGLTNPASWTRMAKSALSHTTVKDYMEFLHDIFFLQWINSFAEEWRAFVKEKKVYFLDPFLLSLSRWRLGLQPHKDDGSLLEQVVFSDLIHRLYTEWQSSFDVQRHLFFVKTKAGKEIDFHVRFKSLDMDIEVKRVLPKRRMKNVLYVTLEEEDACAVPVKRYLSWENLPVKWQDIQKTCQ